MNEEEQDFTPDDADDDLRFAPLPADEAATDDAPTDSEPEIGDAESQDEALEAAQPVSESIFAADDAARDAGDWPLPADEVDLDAALAAVSTLDDMLAEQEAAEQAEQARQQAEADERAEAEARLQNPEYFFTMPPMTIMQRGRMDSVIPALALILLGAWLTFTLTTTDTPLDPALMILVAAGALSIALLARWLATGRWAMGALFFALIILLTGGAFIFLLAAGVLATRWPLLLIGPGLAFLITGLIAGQRRLTLPGSAIIFGGLVALLITEGLLPDNWLSAVASVWPVIALVIALVFVLPLVFRNRQRE